MQEVIFLCEIIERNATGIPPNCSIKFGQLFYIYNHYSQSVSLYFYILEEISLSLNISNLKNQFKL